MTRKMTPLDAEIKLQLYRREKERLLEFAHSLNEKIDTVRDAVIYEMFGLIHGREYDVIIEEESFVGTFTSLGKEGPTIFFTFEVPGIGQVKLLEGQVPALTGVNVNEKLKLWNDAKIDVASL